MIVVINTENAKQALDLIYGGDIFTFIQAPKISQEAVIEEFGEEFAELFDECDSCIGIALDYHRDKIELQGTTPTEYTEMIKKDYRTDHCLEVEITRDEYQKTKIHF